MIVELPGLGIDTRSSSCGHSAKNRVVVVVDVDVVVVVVLSITGDDDGLMVGLYDVGSSIVGLDEVGSLVIGLGVRKPVLIVGTSVVGKRVGFTDGLLVGLLVGLSLSSARGLLLGFLVRGGSVGNGVVGLKAREQREILVSLKYHIDT